MEPRQITGVYGEVSGLPAPVSAHVREEQLQEPRIYTVTAEWSQSELVRCSRLRYLQEFRLISESNTHKSIRTVLPPGPCVSVSGELLSGFSPIRGLRAVIRETSGHQLLEIWNCHGLRKCLNLTALNKHGRVYDDAQFGCLSWSACENKLLYVAERSKNASAETQDGGHAWRKDRSLYCEDWGEALTNRSEPAICVVDLEIGTASVLEGVPPDVSPGQALWAPGSQAVFFIGWYHEPFRLGLKFCSNRRSALFKIDLCGHCERLSGENLSVSNPRLSPDGSTLIYLQGAVFGPHNQCLSLQQLDLESGETSTLLDVVSRPQAGEFAGMYEALPSCCWSADSQRVMFSSACRNWKGLFLVDRRSKIVTSLSDNLSDSSSQLYGSWKLLTVQRDLMVVCCSSPNTPPTLRVGFVPRAGEAVSWQTLQEPLMTFDFNWKVLDVTLPSDEENANYPGLDFGAVLVKPSRPLGETRTPLVVFIHGGPHSQFPAEWNSTTAGLAKLGFAVLMVNYRGSTGFGQHSILSLIGQIGSQDVKDVQRAVLTALERDPNLDPDRLAAIGGSHGGFLACHLLGQYPESYRVCAARNPVINAATLLGTSDIVDWRYTSAGFHYSYDQIPTAEALAAMLQKSPIAHAAKIKAPVLLMLGGRDRRVSPHQGMELYKALKSRGSPVRLLWFPEDGHSLSRVDTQVDCFLNTALWLHQHL
ncbi:acylamino-acid-releasing enzyme isoform X1 [Astatotilapia calliptera]|uniref:acylamino-acid-releasing enzyme isoform X1 n=1 Tax=Astatotilapia calliptera TaxID=8154 RepID=UPI000E424A49|nr:acylamino-acid-releasing enzyme-like isoform X1 [Astatotilapia calliptera]